MNARVHMVEKRFSIKRGRRILHRFYLIQIHVVRVHNMFNLSFSCRVLAEIQSHHAPSGSSSECGMPHPLIEYYDVARVRIQREIGNIIRFSFHLILEQRCRQKAMKFGMMRARNHAKATGIFTYRIQIESDFDSEVLKIIVIRVPARISDI